MLRRCASLALRLGTALLELLDWWRVYVGVLAGLLLGSIPLWVAPGNRWPPFVAVAGAAAGIVAGLLWQARSAARR
ncbi:MAG: hypothetical protein JNL33_14895 [Betaproteobacteria bacterium]|nr:hypothetical protein [Betaproteobacteria bacterium]